MAAEQKEVKSKKKKTKKEEIKEKKEIGKKKKVNSARSIRAVKVCPVCKSENIILDSGAITGKYRCKDCGYIGPIVIEKHKIKR